MPKQNQCQEIKVQNKNPQIWNPEMAKSCSELLSLRVSCGIKAEKQFLKTSYSKRSNGLKLGCLLSVYTGYLNCCVDIASEARAGASDKYWDGSTKWWWHTLLAFAISVLNIVFFTCPGWLLVHLVSPALTRISPFYFCCSDNGCRESAPFALIVSINRVKIAAIAVKHWKLFLRSIW